MSDDPVLTYLKSIDERTARTETAFTVLMQKHQEDDDEMHKDFDSRIKSLEISRTATRAGLAAITLGGGTGAAKLGFLDKIVSMFGGGGV